MMRLPNSERTKDELKKLYRHPHARYWFGVVGVIVVVVVVLAFLLSVQDTTAIEDFIGQDWQVAMESHDPNAYEALWDAKAREEWKSDFEAVRNTIASQQLQVHLEGVHAVTDPVNPKGYIVREVPVTFERGDETVTTQHTIRVARKGWRRQWRLVAQNMVLPMPPEPVLSQSSPNVPATAEGNAGKDTTGFQLPSSGNAPLDTQLKLSQILEVWRTAWEQKDLDEYFSWYAKEAQITRVAVIKGKEYPRQLRKDQLRQHMERLSKKYNRIEVKLSNLEIMGDDAVADVNFLQEYTAWSNLTGKTLAYRDLGTKRLKFMVDPGDGNWKIYAETWKIYRDVPYKL